MPDAAPIITELYAAVRREIEELIRRRDQYITFLLTGSVIVLGFVADKPDWRLGLTAVPLFCLYAGLLYAQADQTIGALAEWVRDDYAPAVAARYGAPQPAPWEASETYKKYTSRPDAFASRYIAVGILLLVLTIVSLGLLSPSLRTEFGDSKGIAAMLVLLLCGLAGALLPAVAFLRRRQQAEGSAKPTGQSESRRVGA